MFLVPFQFHHQQPGPLIDVEAGEEDGAALRVVRSTKL